MECHRNRNEHLGPLPYLTGMIYADLMFVKRSSQASEQWNCKIVNMGMFSAVG